MNKMLKIILSATVFLGVFTISCSTETNQNPWIGKPAPDFQYQDADGQSVSLSNFRGRPVLINFWATWCYPCRIEIPYILQVYNKWSDDGLVLLTINDGESPSRVGEFMQSQGLSFPVLLDIKGSIAQNYNVVGLPTTFFIDKDGIIQDVKVGAFRSVAEIEGKLGKIMP